MATKKSNSLLLKIIFMVVLSLLLLIPLGMVKSQIRDREQSADEARAEVAGSWGREQTLSGPRLSFSRALTDEEKAVEKNGNTRIYETVHPTRLHYDVEARTQKLHRSIYDVMVYTADIVISGVFRLSEKYLDFSKETELALYLSDLRGIEGAVSLSLDGRDYSVTQGGVESVRQAVELPKDAFGTDRPVPFEIRMRLRGSEAIYFRPVGDLTEVNLRADCPTPSFDGDFLPADRQVEEDGFEASWTVSAINRGRPEGTRFGVKLLPALSQYQQTTRTAKYGILIILLVFVAGLAVEFVFKKSIHIIQYLVIGLSLVLFYALLLSFSELMAFWLAYLLAAAMTTAALTGYFRGILKDRTAWLLGALVALAYVVCYILLQMKTFALLAGTLVLFVILVGIMYFTSDLRPGLADAPDDEPDPAS